MSLLAVTFPPGCTGLESVFGFQEQMQRRRQLARIEGRIEVERESRGPLVVVVARVSDEDGEQLVGYDSYVRPRPGTYAFAVEPGQYRVGAYEDRNRNGLLDPGERTRANHDGPLLEVGPGAVARDDIVLPADATTPPEITEPVNVLDLVTRSAQEQRRFSLFAWSVLGKPCEDLSNDTFGPESGRRGLWEMMDFLNEGLAGIYFLEPFDPDRIPVLFVHGIGGYPQQFSTLIERLDHERFQPWFYFYPSGFSFYGLSRHLAALLEQLQVEYEFTRLAVVAHSAGGLVSWGSILRYHQETGRGDVRLLVTLSTPWGGEVTAEWVDKAPFDLPPSIADIAPSSTYLRWLFYEDPDRRHVRHLPESAEFHLVLAFHMSGLSATANDGIVSVASQARLEAQEQAASVLALDYGHVDILHSDEAVEHVNQLLATRFR